MGEWNGDVSYTQYKQYARDSANSFERVFPDRIVQTGDFYFTHRRSGKLLLIPTFFCEDWSERKSIGTDLVWIPGLNLAGEIVGVRRLFLEHRKSGQVDSKGFGASVICRDNIMSSLEEVMKYVYPQIATYYKRRGFASTIVHTVQDDNKKDWEESIEASKKDPENPSLSHRRVHLEEDRPAWQALWGVGGQLGIGENNKVIFTDDPSKRNVFDPNHRRAYRLHWQKDIHQKTIWIREEDTTGEILALAEKLQLLDSQYVAERFKESLTIRPEQ